MGIPGCKQLGTQRNLSQTKMIQLPPGCTVNYPITVEIDTFSEHVEQHNLVDHYSLQ